MKKLSVLLLLLLPLSACPSDPVVVEGPPGPPGPPGDEGPPGQDAPSPEVAAPFDCPEREAPPGFGGVVNALVELDIAQAWVDYRGAREQERMREAAEPRRVMATYRISAEEIDWLRRFAAGASIAEVASSSGRSQRSLYRRLDRLWGRLGVDGRCQALALAGQLGWLDENLADT